MTDVKSMGAGFLKLVLTLAFCAGIGWALIGGLPDKVDKLEVSGAETRERVSLVEKDITYIKGGIDRIERAVKELQ